MQLTLPMKFTAKLLTSTKLQFGLLVAAMALMSQVAFAATERSAEGDADIRTDVTVVTGQSTTGATTAVTTGTP
ncbi:MAG: hypothetical protein AAGN82_28960 [Myxococcota bacterium]